VQAGQPVEEHSDENDEHDHRDDHHGWTGSRFGLFLDDRHVRIVTRPVERKQPSMLGDGVFLTDL